MKWINMTSVQIWIWLDDILVLSNLKLSHVKTPQTEFLKYYK